MNIEAAITLAIIGMVILTLSFTRIKTDVVYIAAIILFVTFDILSIKESFSGFTSDAALSLIFLSIIVTSVRKTGGMKHLMKIVCGKDDITMGGVLVRISTAASALSMLVNNVIVGTIFYADMARWARNHGINPSKIILPLAYAIGFGGVCTIIGSNSNLLTMDIYQEMTGNSMNVFATFPVAFPCLVILIGMTVLLRNTAPDIPDTNKELMNDRKIVLEMLVPSDSKYIGETIDRLDAAYTDEIRLIKICRFDEEIVMPISADEFIMGGDRLVFYGEYNKLLALRERMGFVCSRDFMLDSKKYKNSKRILQNAIVPTNSSLNGRCIVSSDFETRHNVTLLAMMRNGEMLDNSPRLTDIKAGDILMFEGDVLPWEQLSYDILPYGDTTEIERSDKMWITIAILAIVIIGSATGVISLVQASCIAVLLLGALGCISHKAAWNCIPWEQITMIAGAKAIGSAMAASGLAAIASDIILNVCGTNASFVSLAAITAIAIILGQLIYHSTIVALLVPIGITLASGINADPFVFTIAILLCSSCSFMTHLSSSHIALTMPHGNYNIRHLMRYGWPYTIAMYFFILLFCYIMYL